MLAIIHGQSTKGDEEKQGGDGVGETSGVALVKARSAEKAGVRSGHFTSQTP